MVWSIREATITVGFFRVSSSVALCRGSASLCSSGSATHQRTAQELHASRLRLFFALALFFSALQPRRRRHLSLSRYTPTSGPRTARVSSSVVLLGGFLSLCSSPPQEAASVSIALYANERPKNCTRLVFACSSRWLCFSVLFTPTGDGITIALRTNERSKNHMQSRTGGKTYF